MANLASHSPRLESMFRAIVARRGWILLAYALLLPPAIWFASHIPQDAAIPHVESNSALMIYRRTKGGFTGTPDEIEAFRRFVAGTTLFHEQGLVREHFLTLAAVLDLSSTQERAALLTSIDEVLRPVEE